MAKEIERKFLVKDMGFIRFADSAVDISQSYLSVNTDSTVRVRTYGTKAFITVKGRTKNFSRDEWEYEIPYSDAVNMMEECSVSPVITKKRYRVGRWEIDVFHGPLEGLVIAEIELYNEDEDVPLPEFLGPEVTGDPRYYNSALAFAGSVPEPMLQPPPKLL